MPGAGEDPCSACAGTAAGATASKTLASSSATVATTMSVAVFATPTPAHLTGGVRESVAGAVEEVAGSVTGK